MVLRRIGRRGLVLAVAIFLAGCSGGSGQAGAAQAVQAYLEARAASNVDEMARLACPAWEGQARVEATSFQSMNARLEGVSCAPSGADGDYTLVTCQGKIVTTYQGETREWPVGEHPFRALESGGEWRMCGYGE